MLDVLCCPKDGGDLSHARDSMSLTCVTCGHAYPITNGVARFVEDDQYAANFSHEWSVHRTTQLDTATDAGSEATFADKTGWVPEDVSGKRVLDVGCGMGRFADVVLRWGGEVYAVDLSFAVDAAQGNLGHRPGFHGIQASVFDLPFKPASFDLVYSLGVLDHTPDCERAFKCLPRLLKPGGEVAIWIYSAHEYPKGGVDEVRDAFYRRFTPDMSPRTLHRLCRVLCRVPMKHRGLWHMLLPGFLFHAIPRLHSEYGSYEGRVLDTFDWYSPRYQSKHTYPEVCRWFRDEGLVDVRPLDPEVCVRGRKPTTAPAPT